MLFALQRLKVTIFCGQKEFSELDHGATLFGAAAEHILQQRTRTEKYPCYITDLDLSAIDPTGNMQTVNYLRYRQQLEDALNTAMGIARN